MVETSSAAVDLLLQPLAQEVADVVRVDLLRPGAVHHLLVDRPVLGREELLVGDVGVGRIDALLLRVVERVDDHVVVEHLRLGGAVDGVAVAEGGVLGDELETAGVRACGGAVGGFVVRVDDDADFFHAGHDGFLDDDLEGGFFGTVPVDERLEGERALRLAGGGDDGFTNIHEGEQRSEVERLGGTV